MHHCRTAFGRRMLELERRPVRLTWTLCVAFVLPLLLAGIVAQCVGSASADLFKVIVFWIVAFGATVTFVLRTR